MYYIYFQPRIYLILNRHLHNSPFYFLVEQLKAVMENLEWIIRIMIALVFVYFLIVDIMEVVISQGIFKRLSASLVLTLFLIPAKTLSGLSPFWRRVTGILEDIANKAINIKRKYRPVKILGKEWPHKDQRDQYYPHNMKILHDPAGHILFEKEKCHWEVEWKCPEHVKVPFGGIMPCSKPQKQETNPPIPKW